MDIMPPDNQLPPHHAPTGLKLWLAVFAVVLVVALSYLVWASNTAPDTTDNSSSVVKKTAAETGPVPTTSDTFIDKSLGFSFVFPHAEYKSILKLPNRVMLFGDQVDIGKFQVGWEKTSNTLATETSTYIATYYPPSIPTSCPGYSKTAATVGGVAAEKIIINHSTADSKCDGAGNNNLTILLVNKGHLVQITYDSDNEAALASIVSSFKFTN